MCLPSFFTLTSLSPSVAPPFFFLSFQRLTAVTLIPVSTMATVLMASESTPVIVILAILVIAVKIVSLLRARRHW